MGVSSLLVLPYFLSKFPKNKETAAPHESEQQSTSLMKYSSMGQAAAHADSQNKELSKATMTDDTTLWLAYYSGILAVVTVLGFVTCFATYYAQKEDTCIWKKL